MSTNSYEDLVASLNKEFGKNTVVTEADKNVNVIPTGCIALDDGIGVGGIPTKRITEFYGSEGCGKTTMALQVVANAQKMGRNVVYVDAEHALDPTYATALGVNMHTMVLVQPDDAETALRIIESLLRNHKNNLGVVVLDSVASMIPKTEVDAEIGDAIVGVQARLITSFVRKITPLLNHTDAALLLINQQRAQIGGMGGFGAPSKTTPGGHALRHAASLRIEFARTGNVISKEQATGIKVVANIRKNKVAPPYRKVDYEIEFGNGTSFDLQIFNYAIDLGIIKRQGAWYSMNGESVGQGVEKTMIYLRENKKMLELANVVLDGLFIPENSRTFYKEQAQKLYA